MREIRPVLLSILLLAAAAHPPAFTEGDRVYTRTAAVLRQAPDAAAPPVVALLPGDELAVQAFDDDLRDPPAGWLPVATTEVPSHRLFTGFARESDLSADPPSDVVRARALREQVERDLDELTARAPAFATLKDQAMHWKTVPHGEAQSEELARRLASYMATEITPRALDAIDRLDEMRAIAEPHAATLARRLDEVSKSFRP
ncbi:MAG TPA: hypothetical protein VMB50_10540 [Myxococcales bacterium]|nr:hypothetical protein [Myxococcales bacterium]